MPLHQTIHSKLSALLLLSICAPMTFAESHTPTPRPTSDGINPPHSSFVVTLSGGPAWLGGIHNETFYLEPSIKKTYAPNQSTNLLGVGELFLGLQRDLNTHLQGQLGVEVAATGSTKISGMIWDDANPIFNNYTYSYNVQHWHVALKGKALTSTVFQLKPYVSGSVGIGFNQSSHFINNPTIPEAVVMPNFTSHTTTECVFTLGTGVQRAIHKHWQVGVGYEFMYWGRTSLSTAPSQSAGGGVLANHLYTNGLMFNLTYLS